KLKLAQAVGPDSAGAGSSPATIQKAETRQRGLGWPRVHQLQRTESGLQQRWKLTHERSKTLDQQRHASAFVEVGVVPEFAASAVSLELEIERQVEQADRKVHRCSPDPQSIAPSPGFRRRLVERDPDIEAGMAARLPWPSELLHQRV